ncbi:MAG: NAD(P)H-hydrate dehydratase [Burkholderiaceae bacterium]|jgi:hydroxyethylthiazole kinase-like uncharacterized protein yjeF
MSFPLYLTAELRVLEATAQAGLAPGALMDLAGASIAARALEKASDRGGSLLILAGPGNNGGDALTAATLLRQRGVSVRVALLDAASVYHGDAARAWQHYLESGGEAVQTLEFAGASIVIDGLFGIGLNKPVAEHAAHWIARVNEWQQKTRRPVLAIDIPSGLAADTGAILGASIRATHTVSFLGAKPGLYTNDGPDCSGEITIDLLGTKPLGHVGFLTGPADFAAALKARARNSNKGQFGNLGIFAGSRGMVGAALLCSRMALYGGAGRVYVAPPGHDPGFVDWLHPELMVRSDFAGLKLAAGVAGPGLGEPLPDPATLDSLIEDPIPLVLDADALNAVAKNTSLRASVRARGAATVLTPHPLEAARLLGSDVANVQRDRIAAALRLAREFQAHVVLKGAGTVVASPEQSWAINPTGNPGLAAPGTGDVLAGLLGALLAQGWGAWHAALGAVYLHGAAADQLVAGGRGPVGLSASELIETIRAQLNTHIAAHEAQVPQDARGG